MKLTKINDNTFIKSAKRSPFHTQEFNELNREMKELGYNEFTVCPVRSDDPAYMNGFDFAGFNINWGTEILLIIKI